MARKRRLSAQRGFEAKGLRELERNLGRLDDATAGRAVKRSLEKAAEPIRKEWAATAPRSRGGPSHGIGHAADHIVSVQTNKRGRFVQSIGPENKYWWLVFAEFGGGGFKTPLAPGRRAADTQSAKAVRTFADELRREIRRAIR